MDPGLRRELLTLYAEVDRAVAEAGPVCIASGRCCRFKEFGHVLYLSNVEAELLLEGAPSYEGPITPEFCPFQKENLCTAREPRPLGCRIYYCDPNYQETANDLTEDSLRKVKELVKRHDRDWHYAPLHHFLNQPELARPDPVER